MPSWATHTDRDYQRWAHACRARLKGWLPRDKNAVCLDLGCGPGNALYLLRLEGYQNIAGVDLGSQQVALARRVCPNVEQAEALDYLGRRRRNFDLITAFDLIEHFRKDELLDVLTAIRSALKPSGILIIQTPNAESPWGLMHRYHDFTHEVGFDPHSLKHILGISGFMGFEAKECGPYVHGLMSFGRALLWKAIWAGLAVWNLAETGSIGSGIYTRVFIAKVEKPPQ
jgi:SAM-dependent methyltransferase